MKRTVIAGILLLVVAAAIAAFHFLSGEYIGKKAAQAIEKSTGVAPVFREEPRLAFFPPALVVEKCTWKSGQSFPQIDISVQKMTLAVDPLSIFSNNILIKEIVLEQPELVINAGPASVNPAPASPGHSRRAPATAAYELDRLLIHAGKLVYKNAENQSVTLTALNVSAANLRPRQDADFKCDFLLDGHLGKDGSTRLSGNMALRAKARYYYPNLTFRQASATFTPVNGTFPAWLSPLGIDFEGAINFSTLAAHLNSASLAAPHGRMACSGQGALTPLLFDGHATLELDMAKSFGLESTPKAQGKTLVVDGGIIFQNALLTLSGLAIKSGNTSGTGQLSLALGTDKNPPALTGKLDFKRIDLVKTAQTVPPARKNTDTGAKGNSTDATTPASWPAVDLALNAENLGLNGLRATDVHFNIAGRNGEYSLGLRGMKWAGGLVTGKSGLDLTHETLSIAAQGNGMNIGEALGQTGLSGFSGGLGKFDLNMAGTTGNFAKTLTGTMTCQAHNLKIDLLAELDSLLPAIGKHGIPEVIDSFSISAQASRGIVDIRPITLVAHDLDANGLAVYNAAANHLDGKLRMKVLGLDLPLTFKGTPENLSWGIEHNYLLDLMKKLP